MEQESGEIDLADRLEWQRESRIFSTSSAQLLKMLMGGRRLIEKQKSLSY
jgi:hypothetical protein